MADWTLIRSFLAVAEHGSLSQAARMLGATQPTVGRHIKELEDSIGLKLFDRTARGFELTAAGAPLVSQARAMAVAADQFELKAQASSERFDGTVRITASRIVSTYILPPIITAMRVAQPDVQVDIVATDATENLLRRDADLAIRMYEPTHPDLVRRKIAELPLALYGAPAYLTRKGRPQTGADLMHHELVGLDRSDYIIRGFAAFGVTVERGFFPVRCDDHSIGWQLVVAGAGLGFAMRLLGDREPLVERLELDFQLPTLPMWLVMHKDAQTSPRLRFAADMLVKHLPR